MTAFNALIHTYIHIAQAFNMLGYYWN